MKKLIYKYIFIAFILIGNQACNDYLDVVPDNVATIDIAFNSRRNAEGFLFTLYSYMPNSASWSNPGLSCGDEIWQNEMAGKGNPGKEITLGHQSVTNPFHDYWSNAKLFIAIRDCNIFLDNIHKPRDLDPWERKIWIAEAKFLKAYYHWYLMQMYGPIPIIDKSVEISASVQDVKIAREPVEKATTFIVNLIDEAINGEEDDPNDGLPFKIENEAKDLGRITKPIAAAVKAKILVTMASPLFNGNATYSNFTNSSGEAFINPTYDATKWEIAEQACKEAVEMAELAGFRLYKSPGSAIVNLSDSTITKMSIRQAVTEKWNNEMIWGDPNSYTYWIQSASFTRLYPNTPAESLESVDSYWSPTFRMAELFYSNNGLPIEEDTEYDYSSRMKLTTVPQNHKYYMKEGFQTVNLHLNREPRFYASLAFDGCLVYGAGKTDDKDLYHVQAKYNETAAAINTFQYSATGYWPKKLVNIKSSLTNSLLIENYIWPMIRMADLYLLYAETLNETKGPDAAVEYVDKIRERAGLEGIIKSYTDHAKNPDKPRSVEGMRQIIQRERLIELSFEGHRYWDLRRWLKLSEYMNSDIRGWDIRQKTAENYYRLKPIANISWNNRGYLWPIRESSILNNNALVQNPGW